MRVPRLQTHPSGRGVWSRSPAGPSDSDASDGAAETSTRASLKAGAAGEIGQVVRREHVGGEALVPIAPPHSLRHRRQTRAQRRVDRHDRLDGVAAVGDLRAGRPTRVPWPPRRQGCRCTSALAGARLPNIELVVRLVAGVISVIGQLGPIDGAVLGQMIDALGVAQQLDLATRDPHRGTAPCRRSGAS